MSSMFLRGLILVCGAGSTLVAGACSSTASPADGAGAAGGNATAGKGGGTGGSSGAAGTRADAAANDAASGITYFFAFNTGADVATAAVGNSADTDKGDLGVYAAADGGPRATTGFDSTVGDPSAGSLEIQMPCNAYNQFVEYQLIVPVITDLGDKTLSAMIRLDSGFSPAAAPGNVYLYAKSGDNWDWGQSNPQTIAASTAGQWVQYSFPMTNLGSGSTAAFDPGYVKAVGIHIDTGGGGTGVTDLPTPAVFHVDSIGYQ